MTGEVEYTSQSDEELVKLSRAGQQPAFEELINRHRNKVFGQIYKMLPSQDEALDLSQDVWVKAWTRLYQFQGDSLFSTWITRIAINVCLDFLRKRQRCPLEESIEDMTEKSGEGNWVPVVEDDPLQGLARNELAEELASAMAGISQEQRTVLKYMYFDQLEYKEIAKRVGCSIGTVMSRLFYGKKALERSYRNIIEKHRNKTKKDL